MTRPPTPPQRLIGKDATAGIATTLAQHMPAQKLLLVSDDTTWVAAGAQVTAALAADHTLTPHSLGRHIRATRESAQALANKTTAYDGLIAIGSGTINDITKYAAHLANKPYVCVATAASMNGYTSMTASLEELGHKQSFAAAPPRAVIADTTIIAAAPKRLTRAGIGDTLCRSTVETDMLLSHHLLGTTYPRDLFDRMRAHEASLIAEAPSAREGDSAFVGKLMVALLDAGDAMAEYGSSAVASQGEHMIAHTLELMYGAELRHILHGEMIAITTLTMNQLHHKILLSPPSVKSMPRDRLQFERLFGKKAGPELAEQYTKKILSTEQILDINARLATHWPEIKAAILEVIASPSSIERAFLQSGLATRASDIGISAERYRAACTSAYLTRDRFGVLDMAAMNDKRVS